MISKKAFPTYAQYNEDIILLALLFEVEKGFYVDVGANYPTIDSVTKIFYEKGWHGINIEPIPYLHKQLSDDRPRDLNLAIGISDKSGKLEFYENVNIPGHSSFSRKDAEQTDASNIVKYQVEIKTLREVFQSNNVKTIHFLKIDVEGLEEGVIKGNDWKLYRPYVICIEANHRTTKWQEVLVKNDYKFYISDGLNEYYLAKEEWFRTNDFPEKIVELSYEALKQHHYESWEKDSQSLEEVTRLNQAHYEMVQGLQKENEILKNENKYSVANIIRKVKGLTRN